MTANKTNKDFTASNGCIVEQKASGQMRLLAPMSSPGQVRESWVGAEKAQAMREFFAAQDSELELEPEIVLPTEPGFYVDVDGDTWGLEGFSWSCLSRGGIDDPISYAPFTRLVPEPETVEKIAVWLDSDDWTFVAQEIRNRFGVEK